MHICDECSGVSDTAEKGDAVTVNIPRELFDFHLKLLRQLVDYRLACWADETNPEYKWTCKLLEAIEQQAFGDKESKDVGS